MPVIDPTGSTNSKSDDRTSRITTWGPFVAADTFTALECIGNADRSVQVVGTFGSATVVCQISNDGTNWVTATDPLGNAVSFTATGLKQISEVSRYIRPSHSGGGGTESLSFILVSRQ